MDQLSLSPQEFVHDLMTGSHRDFVARIKAIVEDYPDTIAEHGNIVVVVPNIKRFRLGLDKTCVRAIQMLCPSAEIKILESKGLNWGIDDLELTLESHRVDENRRERGEPTDLQLLREFYDRIAEEFWPEELAARRAATGEQSD